MAFKIKVIAEAEAVENSTELLEIMDLASSWCDTGEETRRLFFLANLRCLPDVQKWAVLLPSVLN